MIEEGAEAPDFTLRDQDGEEVALSGLRGKPVVL
jgi:peroxiredoxin